MSMSEMDQGEPGSKDEKIEEVIELNHHGCNSAVSLQLPLTYDSNNHTNRDGEHWHGTSENTNDNKFSGGFSQGNKRDVHVMGSNIQDDSILQRKVPRLNVPSLATCSNNDRAHPLGANVCTISQLQEHEDLPNISAPMVSKNTGLTVTSDVDEFNQNDDQQHSFILEDSRINKDKELIRVVINGTNGELKNLLDLCQNKISFQLSQEALEFCLIQAVRRGQEVKVQQLVYAGAQPANNFKDQDSYTALLVAAENGFTDIARFLLEKGANVNAINNNKDSALILSVNTLGSTEIVTLLLSHNANVNLENKYGFTALMKVLENRDFDTCKLLVDAGADVNRRSRPMDVIALMQLVKSDCGVKTCSTRFEIMKQSAAFQFLESQKIIDMNNENLLNLVVKLEKEDIVSRPILIEMGAYDNQVESYGITPLAIAVMRQSGESLIKCLIQKGARVNCDGVFVPLHLSMSVEVTKLLLDTGADINARNKLFKNTALIVACDKGLDTEVVKLLLAKGAQPNLQNTMGWTALHKATLGANVDLVQVLVKFGADLEIQTYDNKTAYLLAAGEGYIEVIQALQNLGANTSAVDSLGCNDLMLAIQFTKKKCIETSTLLYLAGNVAQINHQCNNGYTALMLAAKAKRLELLKYLLELGADINITASDGPGRNFTALSILLEKIRYSSHVNGFLDCIEELIRHGAVNSLPKSCNDVLHAMIVTDKRRMIQLLLTNGMAPTMASLHHYIPFFPHPMPMTTFTKVSPLAMALACYNFWVAQYLLRNWALCPCDLVFLPLKDLISERHKSESFEIINEYLCLPASLLQLSFITVSHTLGGVPGREDRINSLPLPQVIKKKLMFREEAVHTDLTKNV